MASGQYDLWLYPQDIDRHRRIEADLQGYFMERFADFPHIRLPVAQSLDQEVPFNRLYDSLIKRARSWCREQRDYSPSPMQLNQAFFRAVSRSPKFIIEDDTSRS